MERGYFKSETIVLLAGLCLGSIVTAQDGPAAHSGSAGRIPPAWAYPVSPPAPPLHDDGTKLHVPDSTLALPITQVRDLLRPPDWHPSDRPPMPDAVAHGRKPDVRACGYCHLPNGQGRPENASLAGLPAGDLEQQMADYCNGLRKSSGAG